MDSVLFFDSSAHAVFVALADIIASFFRGIDHDKEIKVRFRNRCGIHEQSIFEPFDQGSPEFFADKYKAEIDAIDDQIDALDKLGDYDQNLIDRRQELVESQRENILAAEDEKTKNFRLALTNAGVCYSPQFPFADRQSCPYILL